MQKAAIHGFSGSHLIFLRTIASWQHQSRYSLIVIFAGIKIIICSVPSCAQHHFLCFIIINNFHSGELDLEQYGT